MFCIISDVVSCWPAFCHAWNIRILIDWWLIITNWLIVRPWRSLLTTRRHPCSVFYVLNFCVVCKTTLANTWKFTTTDFVELLSRWGKSLWRNACMLYESVESLPVKLIRRHIKQEGDNRRNGICLQCLLSKELQSFSNVVDSCQTARAGRKDTLHRVCWCVLLTRMFLMGIYDFVVQMCVIGTWPPCLWTLSLLLHIVSV